MTRAAVGHRRRVRTAIALAAAAAVVVLLSIPADAAPEHPSASAAQPAAIVTDQYRVNFSDAAMTPPNGWLADHGEPFGRRTNGLSYGWIDATTGAPTDMGLYGRNRAPSPDRDVFRESLNHMDYPDATVAAGNWEIALPNGTYRVVAQVGDSAPEGVTGTRHVLRAEGNTLVDVEKAVGAFGVRNAAGVVTVADGRLTLDSVGGTNTKLHLVIVESIDGLATPVVVGSTPVDGDRNVDVDTTISANFLDLPNADSAGLTSLDNSTISETTVQLFEVVATGDQARIDASVNGTGGGDAINLTPASPLNPDSRYHFRVEGVRDLAGVELLPFSIEFETGDSKGQPTVLDDVAFDKVGPVVSNIRYTTVTIGPDGKFYGIALGGNIDRWSINADGSLSDRELLTGLSDSLGQRLPIALTFAPDSTAANLVAYVTHSSLVFANGPAWDGGLSRLSGENLQHEKLLVTGLPRSVRDHLTNSIAFKPDDPSVLYFAQGSNSAGGAADGAWGNREERLLSGALLQLDLDLLDSTPLDVQTSEDQAVINSADASSPTLSDGSYNPYYVDAPVSLYATGLRNAYDLVWHSNGQLYVPTNGTAGGSLSPASVVGTRRPDGSQYTGPTIPAIGPNETQHDWLFRIDPADPHGYYGHPNPKRGEYVLNRAGADAAEYPAGVVPDPNFRGAAWDFGFNKSPNGVVEYRSNAHDGLLQGALLVARYSSGSDIVALVPDGADGDIATAKVGIDGLGGLFDPLDLVEDPTNGNLYVSDFGAKHTVLLKPTIPGTAAMISVRNLTRMPAAADESTAPALPADDFYTFSRIKYPTFHQMRDRQTMRISNDGIEPLEITAITISDPDRFELPNSEDANLPLTVAAGDFVDLDIAFVENVGTKGNRRATLQLHSNAANDPVFNATLNGLYSVSYEGGNEPIAQDVIDAFGFTTSIGPNVRPTSDYASAAEIANGEHGDLVVSELWEAASPSAPVRVIRLASFEGPFASDAGLVEVDTDAFIGGFELSAADEWNQSLFPAARSNPAVIDGHANRVTGPFRIASGGYTTSGRGAVDPVSHRCSGCACTRRSIAMVTRSRTPT